MRLREYRNLVLKKHGDNELTNWLKEVYPVRKQLKSLAKHEIKEFKEAGIGASKFFKGEPISDEEKKALKAVLLHGKMLDDEIVQNLEHNHT